MANMGRGQYNRYVICEKCGTEYFVSHHTCPKCGNPRPLSEPTRRRLGLNPPHDPNWQATTVTCPVCGNRIGQAGIGSHMARMHGQSGVGAANPDVKVSHRTKQRGDWTVSLVNGKKQIAATVSDAVAKRIIGMLF